MSARSRAKYGSASARICALIVALVALDGPAVVFVMGKEGEWRS